MSILSIQTVYWVCEWCYYVVFGVAWSAAAIDSYWGVWLMVTVLSCSIRLNESYFVIHVIHDIHWVLALLICHFAAWVSREIDENAFSARRRVFCFDTPQGPPTFCLPAFAFLWALALGCCPAIVSPSCPGVVSIEILCNGTRNNGGGITSEACLLTHG